MGTRQRLMARLSVAAVTAALAGMLLASTASAQGGNCSVSVSPNNIPVGFEFQVTGNFGGAEVYLVRGANASPAEDAEPDYVSPAGSEFLVVFVAEPGDEGEWTVWGLIPASECGASAALTITAAPPAATASPSASAIPNTSTSTESAAGTATLLGLLILALSGATLLVLRRAEVRDR